MGEGGEGEEAMGDELLAIRFELKQLKGNKILVFKELKNKPYSL